MNDFIGHGYFGWLGDTLGDRRLIWLPAGGILLASAWRLLAPDLAAIKNDMPLPNVSRWVEASSPVDSVGRLTWPTLVEAEEVMIPGVGNVLGDHVAYFLRGSPGIWLIGAQLRGPLQLRPSAAITSNFMKFAERQRIHRNLGSVLTGVALIAVFLSHQAAISEADSAVMGPIPLWITFVAIVTSSALSMGLIYRDRRLLWSGKVLEAPTQLTARRWARGDAALLATLVSVSIIGVADYVMVVSSDVVAVVCLGIGAVILLGLGAVLVAGYARGWLVIGCWAGSASIFVTSGALVADLPLNVIWYSAAIMAIAVTIVWIQPTIERLLPRRRSQMG